MLVYEPRPKLSGIPGLSALVDELGLELVRCWKHYDASAYVSAPFSRTTLLYCASHDFYGNYLPGFCPKKEKVKRNVYKQKDDYPVLPGMRLEDLFG